MQKPTLEELAKMAIDVLNLQQVYFRGKDVEVFRKCKSMEANLRTMAESCLEAPKPAQPSLFDMIDNSDL